MYARTGFLGRTAYIRECFHNVFGSHERSYTKIYTKNLQVLNFYILVKLFTLKVKFGFALQSTAEDLYILSVARQVGSFGRQAAVGDWCEKPRAPTKDRAAVSNLED